MKHKIYLITNTQNDKVYVGYTSRSLTWRLNAHRARAKCGKSPTNEFYKDIRKFGGECFSIHQVYAGDDKETTITIHEQRIIDEYDSIATGYNSKRGGGGVHITNTLSKAVDVYDKNGNLLSNYPSMISVAEKIGCHPGSISCAIKNAANGKGSQVKGYWLCIAGGKPVYKNTNTDKMKAAQAARGISQRGRKRPKQSEAMKRLSAGGIDKQIYQFVNKDGRTFTGTRVQLIREYPTDNIKNNELGISIRGGYKHRGWSLTS